MNQRKTIMEIHKTENYTEFLECTENYFAGNV